MRMRVSYPSSGLGYFGSGAPVCASAAEADLLAGAAAAMTANSFSSRLRGSRRFLNGFLAGAVVGAAGAGLTALQFLRRRDAGSAWPAGQPHGESAGRPPAPGLPQVLHLALRVHTSPPLHP